MHLSASQLNTYSECPRKWYFANVLKRIKPSSNAMLQGSLFHKAFELYFKDGLTYAEVVDKINTLTDVKSIVMNVNSAFKLYLEKYPDKIKDIIILENKPAVEVGFDIKYGDDISIIGFIDYFEQRRIKRYITDIKVTSMALTDWYFQGFELSYQTMLYSYICAKLFDNVAGFIVDAVQIKNQVKGLKVEFNTQYFPLSVNIESFERELFDIASYIQEYSSKGEQYFPHCYSSCVSKYGRCDYFNICTSKEKIQIPYLMESDDFVDKKSRSENKI